MARRDIGADNPRVKVRPDRGSRLYTKQRPSHADAALGMVARIGHGYYRIRLDDLGLAEDPSGNITAMEVRELGWGRIAVGDRVAVVGDTSSRKDILARMIYIKEYTTLLCRSAKDRDIAGTERPTVANTARFVIVIAVANSESRLRMINRYLVAAYDVGMESLIVFAKSDLAGAAPLTGLYSPPEVRCPATRLSPCGPKTGSPQVDNERPGNGVEAVHQVLDGTVSVLMGHFGAGKSALINVLIPGADRAAGHVNKVTGRGRHTSTSLQALELPGGSWVIDILDVRPSGASHVDGADILRGFLDLARVAENCSRGCTHEDGVVGCTLDEWASVTDGPDTSRASTAREERRVRVEPFRQLLVPSLKVEDLTHPRSTPDGACRALPSTSWFRRQQAL